MSDKCEWRDVEFYPCCENIKKVKTGFDFWMDNGEWMIFENISNCPWCGAGIRKPEPEVIIKKSGGTWVAQYDGVDYLCVKKMDEKGSPELSFERCCVNKKSGVYDNGYWTPISEIEITDEIALLRPMVVYGTRMYNLVAVKNGVNAVLWNFETGRPDVIGIGKSVIRLATVEDLP